MIVLTASRMEAPRLIRAASLTEPAGPARLENEALRDEVASLRARAHEYANRIHAVAGMLELGMIEEAKQLLGNSVADHAGGSKPLVERIRVPVLAGLLVEKRATAAAMGTEVVLDAESELKMLPARLSEFAAVSVLGNLIDNAVDAVSAVEPPRRRVEVGLFQGHRKITFRVRDHGPGFEASLDELLRPGKTSKRDHDGLGLSIVGEALSQAGGVLEITCRADGTDFEAVFAEDWQPR